MKFITVDGLNDEEYNIDVERITYFTAGKSTGNDVKYTSSVIYTNFNLTFYVKQNVVQLRSLIREAS